MLLSKLQSNKFAVLLGTCILVLTALILVTTSSTGEASPSGTKYYVDSAGGNDSNDGKSEANPWKTLQKLNTTVFSPGDAIYLKSGSSFTGQLKPIASGAPGQPIILTSYGGSQKPLIAGGGVQPATIYLYNLEHWEISNIEITNYSPTVNVRSGVFVENDAGLRSHIYLRNLEIHNVNGENVNSNWGYDRTNGGIVFYMKGYGTPAYMDDVLIEGNYIHNADRSGIYFYSWWCNRYTIWEGKGRWVGSTNVVVRNNVLNDIGGDGIVLVATDGGLIEHNIATYTNARSGKNNIAIWCGNSDNCLIQYNEAAYTQVLEGDGEGFDIDFAGENNILQYNYSHDNEGGFVLVTAIYDVVNKNPIVRYNVSQNDRQKVFRVVGKRTTGAQIYNNTVYIGPHLDTDITETTGAEGAVGEVFFANNLIINHGTGKYSNAPGVKFSNNCLYATQTREGEPDDPYKITANPLVVSEGSGAMGIDSVAGYKLQAGSPCIDAGQTIEGNGGRDYFGNLVPRNGKPDIGAFEAETGEVTPYMFYTFNDETGKDRGTAHNDAIAVGTPAYGVKTNADAGPAGKYLIIDNDSDYLIAPGAAFDFGTAAFSTSFWLKFPASYPLNRGDRFFQTGGWGANDPGFVLAFNRDGGGLVSIGTAVAGVGATDPAGSWGFTTINADFFDGEWHLITAVFDQPNKKYTIYLDGIQVGVKNFTTEGLDATTTRPYVGIGVFYWNGSLLYRPTYMLDDVAFYKQALTPAQIATYYNDNKEGSDVATLTDPASGLSVTGQGLQGGDLQVSAATNGIAYERMLNAYGSSANFSLYNASVYKQNVPVAFNENATIRLPIPVHLQSAADLQAVRVKGDGSIVAIASNRVSQTLEISTKELGQFGIAIERELIPHMFYTFNDEWGKDEGTAQNHANAAGTPAYGLKTGTEAGPAGKYLIIDNDSDYLIAPGVSFDFGTEAFSASFWVKFPANYPLNQGERFFQTGGWGTSDPGFALSLNRDGGGTVSVGTAVASGGATDPAGSWGFTTINEDFFDGEWHLITLVFDQPDKKYYIYLDGVQAGVKLITADHLKATSHRTYVGIGVFYWDESLLHRPTYMLDDVAFYKQALTPSQIAAYYNANQ